MNGYNLTNRQKELLRRLVRYITEGGLREPISAGYFSGQRYIYFDGGERCEYQGDLYSDLDALYGNDLLGVRYNKQGNPLYYIKQTGYDAVNSNFEVLPLHAEARYNIGAIIQSMSGGSIQAIGFADNAEISQIVSDPALLRTQVQALAEKLLDEVKAALTGNDLVEYVQAVQEFKEELLAEKPTPSLLKRFARTLALLGDVEGTIGLMVRVWPYLYPLLLFAAEKLA
jgi:hypothetical protein